MGVATSVPHALGRRVTWHGGGPHECYPDRKYGAPLRQYTGAATRPPSSDGLVHARARWAHEPPSYTAGPSKEVGEGPSRTIQCNPPPPPPFTHAGTAAALGVRPICLPLPKPPPRTHARPRTHAGTAAALEVQYIFPQESGGRSDVRWVALEDSAPGNGAAAAAAAAGAAGPGAAAAGPSGQPAGAEGEGGESSDDEDEGQEGQ